MFCEIIIDFGMAGDWLLLSGGRIELNIVSRPVSVKNTPGFLNLPDQFGAPHRMISFIW